MGNCTLKGKDFRKIGYTSNTAKSIAINIVSKHYKHINKNETLTIFRDLLLNPEKYLDHENLAVLAMELAPEITTKEVTNVELHQNPKPYSVFGKKDIDNNTLVQMDKAMMLPIAQKGALLPDAHQGYGLPIGGVFAAKDAIIPYGVGLDIGCRMSLSIFDADKRFLKQHAYKIKQALKEHTHFGIKNDVNFKYEHEILDRKEFQEYALANKLHGKAAKQLGTSGSGNHFVELGIVELPENNSFDIPMGNYVGLLSHSGSRGFGAEIAKTYTQIAMQNLNLAKGFQHLAWLNTNSEAGIEYWNLMNLAGDYAKACHDMIHFSLAKSLGLKRLTNIENHHNFAWNEHFMNEELIVHRKGATPAGKGMYGIIPGSMTAPGFIVKGLGNENSLNSASHGAGRKITRNKAKNSITMSELRKHLKQQKVTLIGGGVDESPFVYKDINKVIESQADLISVEGKFYPKIVRMDKK